MASDYILGDTRLAEVLGCSVDFIAGWKKNPALMPAIRKAGSRVYMYHLPSLFELMEKVHP